MAEYDFSEIYGKYPRIIDQMSETFTSHQFILELARQNQSLYVEALYNYRNHLLRGSPAPFLIVHGTLARHLNAFPDLIQQIRKNKSSKDIFGEYTTCSEWRRIKKLTN